MLLLLSSLLSLAHSDTSENLINNENWDGATYGNDPGGCCASISGSGALYDNSTNTIMFSYGQDILSQTIAINEALKLSGIQVDGYNYAWTWRRVSNSGRGGDTLQFEVTVKDANGNEVEDYVYDYSAIGNDDTWYSESGTETFANSYLDPQNIQLKIIGKDGGFWGGYYGPEVKDVSLTLNYTANPCAANPLYDPSCNGYAEAYAQLLYDQNCAADPLYDSGCPGYTQAYYNQQCSINPLYDQGCPGYAQAYFDQQCSIDALYDTTCPGYADAYYDQQCSIDALYDTGCDGYAQAYLDQQCGLDPLYDTTCTGYAQAYFDQQCGLDPLYDTQCPGYAEAVVATYVTPTETTNTTETVSTTSETAVPVTDPEEIAMPSTTGDATVDSILKDLADVPTTTVGMEVETVATIEVEPETQEASQETETSSETDTTGEMEELVAEIENGDGPESEDVSESGGDVDEQDSEGEGDGESESSESDGAKSGKDEKSKDSKREKMKKAIAAKAANLANDMSNMASLEAQQAVQAQVLALINYVPDFNTYQRRMNGGYLPDATGYPDSTVPESKRGLRNGLAQQLLHEKMVEMQYD